jgi:hypothetical protein
MRSLVLVVALLLIPAVVPAQTPLRCVDAQGNLVLTQGTPPPGVRCEAVPALAPGKADPLRWEREHQAVMREQAARDQGTRNAKATPLATMLSGAMPEARLRQECIAIVGGELLGMAVGVRPRPNPVIKQMCDELHARCTLGDASACQILRGQ